MATLPRMRTVFREVHGYDPYLYESKMKIVSSNQPPPAQPRLTVQPVALYNYSFERLIRIEQFTELRAKFPKDKHISSFPFGGMSLDDVDFFLKILPTGEARSGEGSVSIYLHMVAKKPVDRPCPRVVTCVFSVMSGSTGEVLKMKQLSNSVFCINPYSINATGWGWGFCDFLKNDEVQSCLNSDTLTINCLISVSVPNPTYSGVESSVLRYMGTMFTESQFDVVTVRVIPPKGSGGDKSPTPTPGKENKREKDKVEVVSKEITSSKHLLTSASKVFAAAFESSTKSKEQKNLVYEIADFDEQSVELFLRAIHCGKIYSDTLSQRVDLLALAGKYLVFWIRAKVEAILLSEISVDNVAYLIGAAKLYNAEVLYDNCESFCIAHMKHVLETTSWKELRRQNCPLAASVYEKCMGFEPIPVS